MKTPRLLLAAFTATGCLAATVAVAPPTTAHPRPVAGASVVLDWNAIAVRTIATEAATAPPVSTLSFALVQLAVYDAVVSVEGGYRPYLPGRAHPRASTEAAAATAAHAVLRHEFPRSADRLDADYAAFLARADAGRALDRGRLAGQAAAQRLLAARAGDGRSDTATAVFDLPPAAGVWRPTPPAFLPFLGVHLARVRPFVLSSATAVDAGRPDPLGSAAYRRELAEVQAYGSATGSARSAEQTATALFWNANVVLQIQAVMRQQAERRGLSLLEAARAFAVLDASLADSAIACWSGKLRQAFWRPITAIRLADTDGDPLTTADPTWTPLAVNPPYPDHPSGHACQIGAAVETFVQQFGDGRLDLDVLSGPGMPGRHYDRAAALDAETTDARMLLGIHFRRAMVDGNRLGHGVARIVADRFPAQPGRR